MKINANFDARAAVHAATLDWAPSPMPGVDRRMLDRIGEEVARATSIVRYAPGSAFSPHVHTGGEEFLVLEGVFTDEHGDYPVGSYVRNPPETSHTPSSEPGCVLFVKLWQFDLADRTQVRANIDRVGMLPQEDRPGVEAAMLYHDKHEDVRLEHWGPDARIDYMPRGGMEILVLEGGFNEGGEEFGPQSWLRLPIGDALSATAGPDGCKVWVKEGHLLQVNAAIA